MDSSIEFFGNWFFFLFLAFYIAYFLLETVLDLLNVRYIDAHKNNMPPLFKGVYSPDDYQKSMEYTKAKLNFNGMKLTYSALILFTFIFTGFFGYVDSLLQHSISSNFLRGVLYPFAVGFVFTVINLPLSYYFQFSLEEKFGFNRMTKKVFFTDLLKGMTISVVLGAPLVAALLWFVGEFPDTWWFWGFLLIMFFQFFTAAVYPVLLAPIFNKFTPLEDGTLKTRITDLAKKVNFKMTGVYTIDGSKRSSHSNAFFAGIGSFRRIVLFDTLVEQQNEDEIVAIIAHEMGHNKKHHIQKSLVLSCIILFASFYVMAFCIKWPLFFQAFGVASPSPHVGIVLFMMFSSVFMFPISPLFTRLSRKNEYEADEYSVETTKDKKNLISALINLTKENLGNLTPHPWYSAYHYSHPSTIERVEAINKINLS